MYVRYLENVTHLRVGAQVSQRIKELRQLAGQRLQVHKAGRFQRWTNGIQELQACTLRRAPSRSKVVLPTYQYGSPFEHYFITRISDGCSSAAQQLPTQP